MKSPKELNSTLKPYNTLY